jgi:hypothetical protein
MQRFLIQCANFALLVLLFIGVPAVAHGQMGDWEVAPVSTLRKLIFGGLLIAIMGNGIAAGFLIKSRKERVLCWEWIAVFGGLLAVQVAFIHGYLNFEWLKHALQWMQKYF